MTESYDVLLFDLGGVLVRATGNPVAADGTLPADDDFWRRWLLSPAVRDFESGRTSPEEFARAVAAEFELEVGPDEFLRRFRA